MSNITMTIKVEDYNTLLNELMIVKTENIRLKSIEELAHVNPKLMQNMTTLISDLESENAKLKKLDENVKSKIAILKQQKNIESAQTGQFTFLDAQIKFLESLYE